MVDRKLQVDQQEGGVFGQVNHGDPWIARHALI
jgi:hypothetical protein